MENGIDLGEGFTLPLEIITSTTAIFGIRGSGKSNSGAVIAEQVVKARHPFAVIDPTSAWWGMKTSGDGKSPGLPVYVFGGEHGDLPLEPGSGKVIARFQVEQRVPIILDLKLMRKGEQVRFVADFAEELYHINREPLLLILDEAARFAPQMIGRGDFDAARCLGAVEDIATLGRNRGLGFAVLGQRPAKVNKTVLSQCDNLIMFRTVGPQDRKALLEWVDEHDGEAEIAKKLVTEMSSLPTGTAYFWSPAFLHEFRKLKVARRSTFDSGRTPKIGEAVLTPVAFASIDTKKLSAEIAATVERAKADDPKALRARIVDLEKQIAKAPATAAPMRLDDRDKQIIKSAQEQLEDLRAALARHAKIIDTMFAKFQDSAQRINVVALAYRDKDIKETIVAPPARTKADVIAREKSRKQDGTDGSLGLGERAVLIAIAQHQDGVTLEQLSVLTGYKRSSRNTYLQRLTSRELAKRNGDRILATRSGITLLGAHFEPLPTGKALREYWMSRLPTGEKAILGLLCDVFPESLARDDLDGPTGYKRSSRNTYLQRLIARQLVEAVGTSVVRASEVLF